MEPSSLSSHKSALSIVCMMLLITFACYHAEKNLLGDYKLTFTTGREVRIWRPDRRIDRHTNLSVMLPGNVKQYAVRDPYITGYADTQELDLSAEPDARAGYFLIDTKSDKIVAYGMDESDWRRELQKIGWSSPDLKKPHAWF